MGAVFRRAPNYISEMGGLEFFFQTYFLAFPVIYIDHTYLSNARHVTISLLTSTVCSTRLFEAIIKVLEYNGDKLIASKIVKWCIFTKLLLSIKPLRFAYNQVIHWFPIQVPLGGMQIRLLIPSDYFFSLTNV